MAQVAVRTGKPLPTRRRRVLREMRREWTAYLFNAPGMILFLIFVVYAVGTAFWLSFHQWDIIQSQKKYVGLQNYKEVLHDGAFWSAIGHSVYFTFGSMLPTMAIGLGLAILLNSKIRGGFLGAYQQERDRHLANEVVGNTPKPEATERATPVATHHDEVCARCPSVFLEGVGNRRPDDEVRHRRREDLTGGSVRAIMAAFNQHFDRPGHSPASM